MRILLLLVLAANVALPKEVKDAGFRVTLPDDWNVQKYEQGHVVMLNSDASRFTFVRPILGRGADCSGLLRNAFSASWAAFPGARQLDITPVPGARNSAIARFTFRDGRSRGEVLCAETGSRTAMFYGVAAPASSFSSEVGSLTAILRSFRYGGSGGHAAALPRMVPWPEPHERAYTMQVPEGWRISGGLTRIDVTHTRSGVEMLSPDGASTIRLGDARLPQCTVPGPGMASMPQAQSSMVLCPYQTGRQAGEAYLHRTLVREWGLDQLKIVSIQDRPDLNADADRGPAQFGLRVRNAFAQIQFQATRRGQPIQGVLLANTQMMASAQGQNFIVGQYDTGVQVFAGPPAANSQLAAIAGQVVASTRWNPAWWQREQRISRDLADRTLAMMHAQGENQQKAFWDRMAASDRRTAAVNDILGGTVRLTDGQGNTYQAPADSNYYFQDTNAARTAGRPDDAVVRTDRYPSPLVDLRPLEVIR